MVEQRPANTKQDQKRALKEKKLKRPNGETAYKAKVIWEELRQKKVAPEKRSKDVTAVLDLVRGKMFDIGTRLPLCALLLFMIALVLKRDTSRVLQSVLKHGSKAQRDEVFNELKGKLVDIAQNQYAHFILNKMLKYGDKAQKELILTQFAGKIRRLAKHKEASQVCSALSSSL